MKTIGIAAFLLVSWAGAERPAQQPPAQRSSPEIGYKSATDAGRNKTLLLKDFNPTSMLHAAVHKADQAKYYVIDVHNHVNDAQGIDDPMPPWRSNILTDLLFSPKSTGRESMIATSAMKWLRRLTMPSPEEPEA